MRREFYNVLCKYYILALLSFAALIMGCEAVTDVEDDETAVIYLYNYDEEHDYQVGLYLVSGDSLVDSCVVEAYPDADYDDVFEDVSEGHYYIAIFEDQGSDETGRSATFHLEDGDEECFYIDEDSDIKDCS